MNGKHIESVLQPIAVREVRCLMCSIYCDSKVARGQNPHKNDSSLYNQHNKIRWFGEKNVISSLAPWRFQKIIWILLWFQKTEIMGS